MIYTEFLKLLLKFDIENQVANSVDNSFLTTYGENQTVSTLSGGAGYAMQQSQYLGLSNLNFYIENSMTLSFWLYPSNPGVAINPFLIKEEPLNMPVFSIIKSNVPIVYLYEKTSSNNQNILVIDINDSFYSISTAPYDAGMWHHFFIVYTTGNPNGSINIYIDGSITQSVEIGLCPTSIDGTGNSNFYINKNKTDTFQYHETYNTGYIDDIAIFNTDYDSSVLQNLINYSLNYIAESSYSNIEEKQIGILFDDPATIKITSMIDDMSYVFISRNDGNIFRGSPLFWRSRKVFSNKYEQNFLNEKIVISNDAPSIDQINNAKSIIRNGFLEIKNSIIRL